MACPHWIMATWRKYCEQLAGFLKGLFSQTKNNRETLQTKDEKPQYVKEAMLGGEAGVQAFIDTIIEPVYKVIRTGQPVQFVRRHGERWIEYALIPGYDTKGEVNRLRVNRTDITEQKQLNETVKKFERRYHFFLDPEPPGVQVTDLRGEILTANQATLEMTGYSPGELKSIGLVALYAQPETWDKIIETLQKSGKVCDCKVTLRRKNGASCSVILNAEPITLNGRRLIVTALHEFSSRT